MALDPTRANVSDYDCTWGAYFLGLVDKVTPDLKLKTKEVKFGTLGDIKIGERVLGLEGMIKVEGREIDRVLVNGIIAWSATAGNASPGTATTALQLTPPLYHKDLYD